MLIIYTGKPKITEVKCKPKITVIRQMLCLSTEPLLITCLLAFVLKKGETVYISSGITHFT